MKAELRPEEEKDHRAVEEMTREAFWNIHVPGADEHLLIHNLRNTKEFVRDLDFVAIADEKIVGSIVYVETKITGAGKEPPLPPEAEVLTFGPVSVLPKFQNKGIGIKLINHTIKLAKQL